MTNEDTLIEQLRGGQVSNQDIIEGFNVPESIYTDEESEPKEYSQVDSGMGDLDEKPIKEIQDKATKATEQPNTYAPKLTESQETMLTEFVKLLGVPMIAGRCESKIKQTKICQPNTYYPLEGLIGVYNIQYPVIVERAPNGGFGDIVREKLSIGMPSPGLLKGIRIPENIRKYTCFVIDLDTHGSITCDEAIKITLEHLDKLKIKPTAITKKPGGPHIYCVFDPNEVGTITGFIQSKGGREFFKQLYEKLVDGLLYADTAMGEPEHMIRLPNTYSWKDSNEELYGSKYVLNELYQYTKDGELVNTVRDKDKENYITMNDISKLSSLIDEKAVVDRGESIVKSLSSTKMFKESLNCVNDLSIFDFFKKLKESFGAVAGQKYYIRPVSGGVIELVDINTGSVYVPDGYRWNTKGGNRYLNNFTKSYTAEERPVGTPESVLYYYTGRDLNKTKKFLDGLINTTTFSEEGEIIDGPNGHGLRFADDGVYLKLIIRSSKGKETVIEKQIFSHKMKYLGLTMVHLDDKGWFVEKPIPTYLFHDYTSDKDIGLIRCSKKDLNKILAETKNFFYGDSDDELSKTLDILDFYGKNANMENIYDDGFYDEMIVLGGEPVRTSNNYDEDNYYFTTKKFSTFKTGKQVTFEKFIESASKWMEEKFAIPIMYGMEWLGLMNLRKDLGLLIRSGVYIGGRTKSGKSTAMKMGLRGLGYLGGGSEPHERYLQLSGSATPQPIQMGAMISSILTLDEYTNILNQKISQIIRDCVNSGLAQKGVGSMWNVSFELRAGLLVGGESQLATESVGNRFIQFNMEHQTKRGSFKDVAETMQLTYRDDYFQKVLRHKDHLKEYVNKYREYLEGKGLESRLIETYVGLFVINEIHDQYIETEQLYKWMLEHMDSSGVITKHEKVLDPYTEFVQLLSKMGKQDVTIVPSEAELKVTMIFNDVAFQTNKYLINEIVDDLNSAATSVGVEPIAYIQGTAVSIEGNDGCLQYNALYDKIYGFIHNILHMNLYRSNSKFTTIPQRG